jgi:hypothetical protein
MPVMTSRMNSMEAAWPSRCGFGMHQQGDAHAGSLVDGVDDVLVDLG